MTEEAFFEEGCLCPGYCIFEFPREWTDEAGQARERGAEREGMWLYLYVGVLRELCEI
jgi:hypothetical protein